MKSPTIAIIGSGCVGTTVAFSLLQAKLGHIILVDTDQSKCQAEVLDLQDAATPLHEAICVGTLQEAGQCDIAVICAGTRQKTGQSREDLFEQNFAIMHQILNDMKPFNPEIILLVITNPVDAITSIIYKLSKLPANQVIGTGTLLDTIRAKQAVGELVGIAPESVDILVVGAHNDTQILLWKQALIAGKGLEEYPQLTNGQQELISHKVINKANTIIQGKGFTEFGIATAARMIIEAIIMDSKALLPVSSYHDNYECAISMPSIIGNNGIEDIIQPNLTDIQERQLLTSVATLSNKEIKKPI